MEGSVRTFAYARIYCTCTFLQYTHAIGTSSLSSVRAQEWYTLVFVNRKAEQEECHDEGKRLSEIRSDLQPSIGLD